MTIYKSRFMWWWIKFSNHLRDGARRGETFLWLGRAIEVPGDIITGVLSLTLWLLYWPPYLIERNTIRRFFNWRLGKLTEDELAEVRATHRARSRHDA